MEFLEELYNDFNNQDANVKMLLLSKMFSIGKFFINKKSNNKFLEAEHYLIEQIKKDENMPVLAKAAMISNSSKIIKEYTNQNEIVNMALDLLDEKANPEGIENEWLSYFFDQCKNVDKEEIKIIWAKILAKECENNNSVPKRLLSILSSISFEEAQNFCELAKFGFYFFDNEKLDWHIYYDTKSFPAPDINSIINIYYDDLFKLEEAGLIRSNIEGYSCCFQKEVEIESTVIYYHEKSFKLYPFDKRSFNSGNIILTESGKMLMELILPEKLDEFYEYLINILKADGKIERL